MINDDVIERFLTLFPDLQDSDAFTRQLQSSAELATLPAGQRVCLEGDSCGYLAFILDGTARVYKLGETGRETTLYRIDKGNAAFSHYPAF